MVLFAGSIKGPFVYAAFLFGFFCVSNCSLSSEFALILLNVQLASFLRGILTHFLIPLAYLRIL